MIKTKLSLLTGFFIAVAGIIFLANQVTAADVHLVKIQPETKGNEIKGLYADPPILYVKKNAIVLWMSGIPKDEIQIVFNEGRICRDVTVNPNLKITSFFMDAKNCYVTSFLPYCATTSLQFPEIGTFAYEVVTESGDMKTQGKIIVKE